MFTPGIVVIFVPALFWKCASEAGTLAALYTLLRSSRGNDVPAPLR